MGDPMETLFAQHIGIAEHQLHEYVKTSKTFERALRRYASTSSRPPRTYAERIVLEKSEQAVSTAQLEAQRVWLELWTQLDQARELANGRGRDVAQFDLSRGESRTMSAGGLFDGGEWLRDPFTPLRTVDWHVAPHAVARTALDALRGAMPEVVIPDAAASGDIPQLRGSPKVLWVIAVIAIAAASALVVALMRGSHVSEMAGGDDFESLRAGLRVESLERLLGQPGARITRMGHAHEFRRVAARHVWAAVDRGGDLPPGPNR
jgi:hypothetical protein